MASETIQTHDTPKLQELYGAIEISQSEWKLAFTMAPYGVGGLKWIKLQ